MTERRITSVKSLIHFLNCIVDQVSPQSRDVEFMVAIVGTPWIITFISWWCGWRTLFWSKRRISKAVAHTNMYLEFWVSLIHTCSFPLSSSSAFSSNLSRKLRRRQRRQAIARSWALSTWEGTPSPNWRVIGHMFWPWFWNLMPESWAHFPSVPDKGRPTYILGDLF